MKFLKSKKEITMKILSLLIIIILIFNGIKVNINYPSYQLSSFNLKEDVHLNGLCYKFNDFKILKHKDFLEKYPSADTYNEKQLNILIDVDIENISDTYQTIMLADFFLESEGWASNLSIYTFYSLNKIIDDSYLILKPNQKTHLTIPFTYYMLYDEKVTYEDFIQRDFFLNCYMEYPQKTGVNLNSRR